ncbi:MAG: hypothetical protein Q4D12_06180 [Bacteroidales bacterium]|nr:hypothetical protein [Bacteroidales bacterium]
MKKVFVLLMMPLLGTVSALAQDEVPQVKVTTVTVPDTYWEDASDENSRVLNDNKFKDNWFFGVQAGSMMSWGTNSSKASFMDNQNVAFGLQWGKWLAPYMGVRLTGIFGHNRGQFVQPDKPYHWLTYGANFDMLLNLTNMVNKYKEDRKFNLVGIIGTGLNHAGKYNTNDQRLGQIRSNFLVIRAGLEGIFRLSNAWDFNVEVTNNWINSNFDGQDANNRYDGHLDILLGLTYRFKNHDGARQFTYAKYNASRYDYLNDEANRLRAQAEAKRNAAPIINIQKKVVEGNLVRTLISFADNKSNIDKLQEVNVFTAAENYKKMSDASIYITNYGDTKANNQELFADRANSVKMMLMNEYNIPAGHIFIEANPQIIKNLDQKNTVIVFINE